MPERLLSAADERATVPLGPGVESLNVGVAAGVLLFEAARQRREHRSSSFMCRVVRHTWPED